MIYYQTTYPERMDGALLDEGLARGWYRIAQGFITTDLIGQEDKLLPVFWLRIDLKRYRPSRSARRIIAKNSTYEVQIKPFAITPEIEALFTNYRQSIDFSVSDTVAEYLLGAGETNAFDSRLIEVRDHGRLIAVGYFDLGARSSTGILHFYDPALADQSLGKLLFLVEIEDALNKGFDYYYMGYLCCGNSKFDYKLFADSKSTELFLRKGNRWVPYERMASSLNRWSPHLVAAVNKIYKLVPTGN